MDQELLKKQIEEIAQLFSAAIAAPSIQLTPITHKYYDCAFCAAFGEEKIELIPGILYARDISIKGLSGDCSMAWKLKGRVDVGRVTAKIALSQSAEGIWNVVIQTRKEDESITLLDVIGWCSGMTESIREFHKQIPLFDVKLDGIRLLVGEGEKSLREMEVLGQLEVLGILFGIKASFPGPYLQGRLADGITIDFPMICRQMSIPEGAADVFPVIKIDKACLKLSVPRQTFEIQLVINNIGWRVCEFLVSEIKFYIKADCRNHQMKLAGSFEGRVLLCYGIELSFSISYEQGKSWRLQASGTAKKGVTIHNFLVMLSRKYNAVDLPGILDDVSLRSISLIYEWGTNSMQIGCETCLRLNGKEFVLQLVFAIRKKGKDSAYTTELSAVLSVDDMEFQVEFFSDKSTGLDLILFTYQQEDGHAVALDQLLRSFMGDRMLPISVNLELKQAGFIYMKKKEQKNYSLNSRLGLDLKLQQIPVLSSYLPDSVEFSVHDLQIGYQGRAYAEEEIKSIEAAMAKNAGFLSAFRTYAAQEGFYFSGIFSYKKGEEFPFWLGAEDSRQLQTSQLQTSQFQTSQPQVSQPQVSQPQTSQTGSQESKPIQKWFDIHKNLGPVSMDRVGIRLEDDYLYIMLDAALALGVLKVEAQSLMIGCQLNTWKVKANLKGLAIGCKMSGLEISGGLFQAENLPENVAWQYDGKVTISAAKWQFMAVGSYASMKNGASSLFIFAEVNVVLGGTPAFVITGLMAGFGVNRRLVIPELKEVKDFPLFPTAKGGKQEDILKALNGQNKAGKQWLYVDEKENFLAAGIRFKAFEMMDGNAILVAQFGHELSFSLLGLAQMSLPKGAPRNRAYVYVELELLAVLKPVQGYLGISACLSKDSFLINENCHLTGGFTFCVWFGRHPQAGQFVLSVGGYHPAFRPPAYYPSVDRVGFQWNVDSHTTVKGEAYLAVTPSCIMAGGSFEFLYANGNLRAWFIAYAHFLLAWKPFFFRAEMGVEVGASYRLNLLFCHVTIKVSVGASLKLWGPPTGGTARIHLSILSFSVSFGHKDPLDKNNDPLLWDDFKGQLPANEEILKINITSGLLGEHKGWIVKGGDTVFTAETTIPVCHDSLSIRPMNQVGLSSPMMLWISAGAGKEILAGEAGWQIKEVINSVPASLWGEPLMSDGHFVQESTSPDAKVVEHQVCAYEILAPRPEEDKGMVLENTKAALTDYRDYRNPLCLDHRQKEFVLEVNPRSIDTISHIGEPKLQEQRKKMVAALSTFTELTTDDFTGMGAMAESLFTDAPMEVSR